MTINSADEFLRLRFSDDPADYRRAADEEAPLPVWREIVAGHPEARFWVAQNKTVPLEILEILAVDPDARVRHAVAMKRKLTPGMLARLASDGDESIRMRVAMHRNTATETLESLRNDPWDRVREIVDERLSTTDRGVD